MFAGALEILTSTGCCLGTLDTLYNASLPPVDVHIVRTEGSNHFSSSCGGSKRDGGCEIACAFFSY
jgi:hypothetical protein